MILGSLSAATIPQREARQHARIAQGVRSGTITGREAVRLNAQSNMLHREIRRDRIDGGRFTAAERRDAQQDLNTLSRRIRHAKRN
jgi:IS30 family transposase